MPIHLCDTFFSCSFATTIFATLDLYVSKRVDLGRNSKRFDGRKAVFHSPFAKLAPLFIRTMYVWKKDG